MKIAKVEHLCCMDLRSSRMKFILSFFVVLTFRWIFVEFEGAFPVFRDGYFDGEGPSTDLVVFSISNFNRDCRLFIVR